MNAAKHQTPRTYYTIQIWFGEAWHDMSRYRTVARRRSEVLRFRDFFEARDYRRNRIPSNIHGIRIAGHTC